MSDDPVSRSLGIPLFWLFFWALPLSTGPALASGVATSLMLESPISSGVYPITLPASRLPQLRGIPWAQLTLYRMDDSVPVLIPFQIDRRDVRGRLLTEPFHEITDQDEFVFMARDIGQNLPEPASIPNLETIARITVTSSSEDGYLFIARSTKGVAPRAQQDYVHYDTATDCVRSKAYEICFAAQQPFLMNSVRWRRAESYGENLADHMKVRHYGKLFGQFDFFRSEEDYHSKLLSIKDGPIRVIRQTRNQVRVVWRFKSPSVDIDYVLYGNHILMDTLLDLPFPIGWLFKELTTFASLDMSPGHNLQLYVPDTQEWLAMDGRMSVQEMQFNRAGHKDFVLNHPDGTLAGTSYLSHSLPIYWQITLQDDVQQPDPPETIPGQIGNIGFDTRNWESVDGRVHHLYYSFYLLQETPATKARSILLQGPSYGTP